MTEPISNQTNISLEKVIKGLECCTQHGSMCGSDCNGYWGWTDDSHTGMELLGEYRTKCSYGNCETGCVKTLARDTLVLLKTQEPIEARLHLCESCTKRYPDCNSDYIEFGCGFGNDNVIGCDAYTNRWVVDHDCQRDYEAATEMTEHCERYEPTYNPEDGSM